MTGDRALAAIFLSPVAMALVIGLVFLAAEGGSLTILGWMVMIALVTSGLIFALARLMATRIHSEFPGRFAGFAAELGGEVLTNALGERQLRVPHPRGRVELDFRHLGGDGDGPGDPFTRVALICAPGSLPRERHKLSSGSSVEKLSAEARAAVAALQAVGGGPTRVILDGRARAPTVEVWVHGWVADPAAARRTVESARPHLEALASRPWAAAPAVRS